MPHVPLTVVVLRPLDELGEVSVRPSRAERARAHRAASTRATGKRGVLEMLDLAIGVLRDNFAVMVGLGALAWLPVRVLQPFVGAHVWIHTGSVSLVGPILGSSVSWAGAALAQSFSSAMIARLAFAALEGRKVDLGDALRAVLRRLHIVVGVAFVTALASSIGFCACVLPYFLLDWKLSCAPMACVVEGRGMRASLDRSFALTRRGLGRWVVLALCAWLIGLPFAGAATGADFPGVRAQALAWSGLSATAFDVCMVILSSLMLGVAIALRSCVLTAYYADCLVRREGADLEAEHARLATAEVRP